MAKEVFDQCSVAFVSSHRLPPSAISELEEQLKKHGGRVLEPNPDGTVNVAEATHIIANTINFSQYVDAMAQMVPVVSEVWISHSLARGRQCPIRPYSPDPRLIFSSVVVTTTEQIPDCDREAIAGAVTAMGGMESREFSRTTTHLCALSMDDPKCQTVVERKLKRIKIVLPHWFDDCFKLGKRIDETPYLLPDPPLLREQAEDHVKIPVSHHLSGATTAHPDYLPASESEQSARQPLLVFQGKKVYLSDDLHIKERLRNILVELITNGQGRVVDDDLECDWFVCQYRHGPRYIRAAQAGKEVGNLSWLYHLITYNEYASPFNRLLHYPLPKEGLPGFENLRITVSNYGGEARIYLENLIRATGATFTRTMTNANTHLITARASSEKCEAAKDWNISMINHLWLEESYARCEIQALTVPKYTHFPPRTNLGEVIGQTFLDETRVRLRFYAGGEERLDAEGKRKRKALDDAHKNAAAHGPAAGVAIARYENRDFGIIRDGNNKDDESSQGNSDDAKQGDALLKTPVPKLERHMRPINENATSPIMSSRSRSAKISAITRIQGLADDVQLYEKERKRSCKGAPWGGKRAAAEVDKQLAARHPTSGRTQEESDEDEESKRPAKKMRPSLPDIQHRVCITGWQRWVGNRRLEEQDRKKLRAMGIHVVEESMPCDFLVAPYIIRTKKFLVALARGVPVLATSFLEDSLDVGEPTDPKEYMLQDKEGEKKFNVKLSDAVARAKANKGKLLSGIPIYCTENITYGVESFRMIAEANGANPFKVYRARSGITIKPTTAEEDGGEEPDPVYLLTSPTPNSKEKALWPKFRKMAEDGHMTPLIVKSDWLLDVAMKQKISKFDKKYFAE